MHDVKRDLVRSLMRVLDLNGTVGLKSCLSIKDCCRMVCFKQVGVEMHGVDEILRKLVGMKGVLADILMGRKDLSSIMDPLTAMDFGKVAAEIKKILAQVSCTLIGIQSQHVLFLKRSVRPTANDSCVWCCFNRLTCRSAKPTS